MTRTERLVTFSFVGVLLAVGVLLCWRSQSIKPDTLANAFDDARAATKAETKSPGGRPQSRCQRVDALYEKILLRHPEMAVTYKDVPDDKNGVLKWLAFEKTWPDSDSNRFGMPDEIKEMLNDPAKWDPELAARWLSENKALLDEIADIGLTAEQSVRGIELPNSGFFNAGLASVSCELLCLQARLQASQGDPEAALRSLQAAMGLANHFDQIETPSTLHSTVSNALRLCTMRQFYQSILPSLPAESADLSRWQQALYPPQSTSAELARIQCGEWHVALRYLLLPMLINNDRSMPGDPERFIDAWTDRTKQRMDASASTDWMNLETTLRALPKETGELSKENQQLLDLIETGSDAWIRGWTRVQCARSLQTAVFAHLRGEPLPTEPITGLPYIWDAATRTVSAPVDPRLEAYKIKPVTLPR